VGGMASATREEGDPHDGRRGWGSEVRGGEVYARDDMGGGGGDE
jgi:hypothetical protein